MSGFLKNTFMVGALGITLIRSKYPDHADTPKEPRTEPGPANPLRMVLATGRALNSEFRHLPPMPRRMDKPPPSPLQMTQARLVTRRGRQR